MTQWVPAEYLPGVTPPPSAPVASVVPSASASSATPEPKPAPPPTPEEEAAQGNPKALAKLQAIPLRERTPEQNAALARGRVAVRLAEVTNLGELMKKEPALAEDPATLKRLLEYARDPHTTIAAQTLIAAQQRPSTSDLLFEVWTGVPDRTPVTELAELLVTSDAVRKHASPALAVVLALREVESCDAALELITKVNEVGDRRAVLGLLRLPTRRDCGPQGTDLCFPCLRAGQTARALALAAAAAQKRVPPTY